MKKWVLFVLVFISAACSYYPETVVTFPDGTSISARVANTYKKQERAWLGQKAPFKKGVLFVFLREEEQAYWRKNTLLDLDVIFLDEKLRVTHLLTQVERRAPKYNINSEVPIAFAPAKYILELPAGMAPIHHITQGATLKVDF